MTITSGLFNSINGDRKYDAKWFAQYFATFIGNGVFPNPSTGLQVVEGVNMTTVVKVGKGWIEGYFIVNDADYVLTHDIADGVLKRIDRVVMRLNYLTRQIEVVVKKGAFASTPVAPILQRDTEYYELALADILIGNGATQITQANITDTRLNTALCGIVHGTVNQVDTTTIFNQYQSWLNEQKATYVTDLLEWTEEKQQEFETWTDLREQDFNDWFASIQGILDGDVAANLATRILTLENQLGEHLSQIINSESGIHGQIRYFREKLQIKVDGEWIDFTSGSKIALKSINNFLIKSGNAKATLTWSDPEDIVIDGYTLATWAGTRVVRKIGSYPENENDGVLVFNSGVKDQYSVNGYEDTGLINETPYYYSIFPYTTDGVFSQKTDAMANPKPVRIYGIKIDTTNSNPLTSVTRINDAANMNVEDFWSVYPWSAIRSVLLKDGQVIAELPRTLSHSFIHTDGSVMTEFSKFYWKFESIGTDLYVRIADGPVNGYVSPAFKRGATEKDKFYFGRYLGYDYGGKLISAKGLPPTDNKTISEFRTLARANGVGYEQADYFKVLAIQILYLIQYANLDSQAAIGRGYVNGHSTYAPAGGTDGKGMNFGEATGNLQMSLYGIEDFWGNKHFWLDGLVTDANYQILIGNDNFNDSGNGYASHASGINAVTSGYISSVQGGNETGFIIKDAVGSETTHFTDYGYLGSGVVSYFGGLKTFGATAGVFCLQFGRTKDYAHADFGARLCFM